MAVTKHQILYRMVDIVTRHHIGGGLQGLSLPIDERKTFIIQSAGSIKIGLHQPQMAPHDGKKIIPAEKKTEATPCHLTRQKVLRQTYLEHHVRIGNHLVAEILVGVDCMGD